MVDLHLLKGKKVAIFGTGLQAVAVCYMLEKEGIAVQYFLNNHLNMEEIKDIPVYEPSSENVKGVYIIVAVGTEPTYLAISKQLQSLGCREFEDYIYHEWIGKKVVLLHGNCHMIVIKAFLLSSKGFCRQYGIYPNPLICENKEKGIKPHILKECDVWIHEDIRTDNPYGYFLSDEYMRQHMKADCIEIIMPNLFGLGKGFFPQSTYNERNGSIANGADFNGLFPRADAVIDKCIGNRLSTEEIIEFCKSDEAILQEEILENFAAFTNKISEREKKWDIKISEFILQNYKDEKLFFDMGHPTNIIFEYISAEILKKLHISADNITADCCLDNHEEFVYPVVKRVLGLNWSDGNIRKSGYAKKLSENMDFEEYIREYIWWCYYARTESDA